MSLKSIPVAVRCGILMAAATTFGCRTAGERRVATDVPAEKELSQLVAWMTGSFSSAAQHEGDPQNYFDIRLHMTPIWPERRDGHWLYVEQAAADAQDRPYRQRIYRVSSSAAGQFESAVYELTGDPLRFAGAWRDAERFTGLSPSDLVARDGCTMYLRREPGGAFVGGTRDTGCTSTLRGAAYATSEASITADGLVTWDRGYDKDGKQVWGATAGGYRFMRVD